MNEQTCLCYQEATLDTAELPSASSLGCSKHVNRCAGACQTRAKGVLMPTHGEVLRQGGCERRQPPLPRPAATVAVLGTWQTWVNPVCMLRYLLVFRHERCEHACPQHRYLGAPGHGRWTNHQVVVLEQVGCMEQVCPTAMWCYRGRHYAAYGVTGT